MNRVITVTECLTQGGANGQSFTFTNDVEAVASVREITARCYAAYYMVDGYNGRTYMMGTEGLVAQGMPTELVGKIFNAETGEILA